MIQNKIYSLLLCWNLLRTIRDTNDGIHTNYFFQALQFSKNKTDLSRKNDVFEVSLKRKRDPTVDDDEDDADGDEGDNIGSLQEKE